MCKFRSIRDVLGCFSLVMFPKGLHRVFSSMGMRTFLILRATDLHPRLFAAIAVLVIGLLPSDGIGINVCPFGTMLGFSCPLCGLTRSMSCLLHLEFLKSFSYHPLGILVLSWLGLIAFTNRPDFNLNWHRSVGSAPDRSKASSLILPVIFLTVWFFRLVNSNLSI